MFFMLFFWILIIICLSLIIKGFIPSSSMKKYSNRKNPAAFDIFCERYAKGEIDRAEYKKRKKTITG